MVKIVLFLLSAAVAIVVCIQEQVFLAAAVVFPGRCTSANVTPHVGSKRRRVEYDDAEDGAEYGDCLDFLGRGKRH